MGFERTAFRFVVGVHTDDVTLDASIVFLAAKALITILSIGILPSE